MQIGDPVHLRDGTTPNVLPGVRTVPHDPIRHLGPDPGTCRFMVHSEEYKNVSLPNVVDQDLGDYGYVTYKLSLAVK